MTAAPGALVEPPLSPGPSSRLEAPAKLHQFQGLGNEFLSLRGLLLGEPDQRDLFERLLYKAEVVQYPGREPRENLRYVVTNMSGRAADLYSQYAQRGDSENRIKEANLAIRIDRLSCGRFFANQLRALLGAMAYALFQELRLRAKRTPAGRWQGQLERSRTCLIQIADASPRRFDASSSSFLEAIPGPNCGPSWLTPAAGSFPTRLADHPGPPVCSNLASHRVMATVSCSTTVLAAQDLRLGTRLRRRIASLRPKSHARGLG